METWQEVYRDSISHIETILKDKSLKSDNKNVRWEALKKLDNALSWLNQILHAQDYCDFKIGKKVGEAYLIISEWKKTKEYQEKEYIESKEMVAKCDAFYQVKR